MSNAARNLLTGTLAAFIMATPGLAAEETGSPSKKKQRDPNEVVCEKEEIVGSRLATRRVCMTRAEWAQKRKNDRELVEHSQVQPWTGATGN